MRIGIIGAGKIGGTLAHRLAKLGHTVAVANSRGPETLKVFVAGTNVTAATAADAVKDKDVIVLSIPLKSVLKLNKDLFAAVPASTVLIDTGNFSPARDGGIAELESVGAVESAWVQQQIGHTVLKVFNNIFAGSLNEGGLPAGTAGRIALPVAGDNVTQKEKVIALLDELGFDGVDAGSLAESWRQQPGTPVYGTEYDISGVRRALAAADSTVAVKHRQELTDAIKKMMPAFPPPRLEFVQLLRDINDPKAV